MYQITRIIQNLQRKFFYFKRKGYYTFIGTNVLRIVFFYGLVIVAFILLGRFLLDFDQMYQGAIDKFTNIEVLSIFFVSEAILGPLPPDIFMLWAGKFNAPVLMLTLLGILSYIGGVISYQIGTWISGRPKIKAFTEKRLEKYINLTRKWGGAFITIAALFPFSPYATVVLAVSILKYPFRMLLIFGLFRIVRFVVQGMLMIHLIDLGF